VQTAITMGQVAEPYIPRARCDTWRRPHRQSSRGPGPAVSCSTDTTAAQRALEVGCQAVLMGKQGVDGVYDADPKTTPNAVALRLG